mmetsp:Transcript_8872/g.13174  ORF Transcript_8872/g.13174 Transcript_8872/m.13174 type:complete len:196 (+) Transcript_8872:1320-1907(+)
MKIGSKGTELVKSTLNQRWPGVFASEHLEQVCHENRIIKRRLRRYERATISNEMANACRVAAKALQLVYHQNIRCLIVYLYHRMKQIRQLHWQGLKSKNGESYYLSRLHSAEKTYLQEYHKTLQNHMKHIDIDLTTDREPPQTVHVEVKCNKDHERIVLESGREIEFHQGDTYYMKRSDAESFIQRGYLTDTTNQ